MQVDGHGLRRVLEHAISVRDTGSYPNATFYDMHFSDFVTDQFAVVSDIYDALGLPMTDEGATRMRAFIADNPKGKHGVHSYTPEEFGIDPAVIRRAAPRVHIASCSARATPWIATSRGCSTWANPRRSRRRVEGESRRNSAP